MKKLLLACIALMLLALPALAEYEIGNVMYVTNCNEYITLRAEPSTKAEAKDRIPLNAEMVWIDAAEGDFAKVSYDGQVGYVLRKYLGEKHSYSGGQPVSPDRGQRYNINLFLSNFTETYFAVPDGCVYQYGISDDAMLNNFALDHIWFNKQHLLEWGEWGGPEGNNVRVAASELPEVILKYFGVQGVDPEAYNYVNYDGEYYYWTETGGHVPDGFACATSVNRIAEDMYGVYFNVYGSGYAWENDMCYLDAEAAQAAYPYGTVHEGFAVIHTSGPDASLDDRAGWSLQYYVINTGW